MIKSALECVCATHNNIIVVVQTYSVTAVP